MANNSGSIPRRRKPWWHYLFGCVWEYNWSRNARRCACGRRQDRCADRDGFEWWEDDTDA